jgi:ribonuclease T
VVVDVETGGFDWNRHALLEIAAVPISRTNMPLRAGRGVPCASRAGAGYLIDPVAGSHRIKIGHPLRFAVTSAKASTRSSCRRAAAKRHGCQRAILVGHNAHFDLNFLNAAVNRVQHKRNPFHPFSVFDT